MHIRTSALAAASVASFLVPFMMSAVAITLPVMQVELGATAVELSWIAGSYILALAAIPGSLLPQRIQDGEVAAAALLVGAKLASALIIAAAVGS